MLGSYLVQVTRISKEIAEELAHFGSVGLVSKSMCIYSLETQVEFIPIIEALSFVVVIEMDGKGFLKYKV